MRRGWKSPSRPDTASSRELRLRLREIASLSMLCLVALAGFPALQAPATAQAGSGFGEWLQVAPEPRVNASLVWDTVRNRLVLFGGYADGIGAERDTWEWDGEHWTRTAIGGPSERELSAMAFDSARGRVVLVSWTQTGPTLADYVLTDTWIYDGAKWCLLDLRELPPNLGGPCLMTYDSDRDRMVLAGWRYRGPGVTDTWEFDGTSWARVCVAGPPLFSDNQSAHVEMVYDSGRKRTLAHNSREQKTWEWDGTTWTLRLTGGPSLRTDTAMAYDPQRGRVVLFGGGLMPELGDTWEYDGTTWTLRTYSGGPEPRFGHSMVYDPVHHGTILFGGMTGTWNFWSQRMFCDLWLWNGSEWSVLQPSLPTGATNAAMAYDELHGDLLHFGVHRFYTPSYDNPMLHALRGDFWERLSSGSGANAPQNIGLNDKLLMVYDRAQQRTVLFNGAPSETWEWLGDRWVKNESPGPSARTGSAMAYDTLRGRSVLFGGWRTDAPPGDTWIYSAGTWTRLGVAGSETFVDIAGPEPRYDHAMAYDPGRDRVVLFGGRDLSNWFDDTWEFDGNAWEKRDVTGPPAREGHVLVYDPGRAAVVMNGGLRDTDLYGDTWTYDASGWTQLFTPRTGGRRNHAAAYSPARGSVVFFGGATFPSPRSDDRLQDTWELLPGGPIPIDLALSDPAWAFVHTDVFSSPTFSLECGPPARVEIKAANNLDTFGFWEGPAVDYRNIDGSSSSQFAGGGPNQRPLLLLTGPSGPNDVLLARYPLSTDVIDPAQVPQFRLRCTRADFYESVVHSIESRGDGALSPRADQFSTYTLPLHPPGDWVQLLFSLDLVNFDPDDAAQGNLLLQNLSLEAARLPEPSQRTLVREYTFDRDPEGWVTQFTDRFTSPILTWSPGALTATGIVGDVNTFGYWASPVADIAIDASRLYVVTFKVESDQTRPQAVPQFRVRINEGGMRQAAYLVVDSIREALESPTLGAPKEYALYFQPLPATDGQPLLLAFDFLNFEPSDKADAILSLNRVRVETVDRLW